jgi:UPF0755 protein
MSRFVKILTALAGTTLLAALVFAYLFTRFLDSPVEVAVDGTDMQIRPGMSFRQVSDELAERGIISRPTFFRLFGRMSGKAGSIHAGEYHVEAGSTPRDLFERFVAGDVILYSFTIVEGWTFRELMTALGADPVVDRTLEYEDWPALLETLGAEYGHPEGLFLPETYRFPKGTTDVDLLRQANQLLRRVLADEWAGRATNLPLKTPYEALIMASIVEKETALAAERPRIAGVFIRRLLAGMRLQTDPTVIYGIGDAFDGNLTREHLRTDTAYNTYTRGGLPPSPIALAGRAAIHAALNPADGSELYFVATGVGDGSHKFSDTKEQHDKAVAEYLARQRETRDREAER